SDVFASTGPHCGWPLRSALEQVGGADPGVIVVLRRADDAADILQRMRQYQVSTAGDTQAVYAAPSQQARDLRTYGVGAQILTDLGVRRMRVLSAPKRMHALSGFGMEVVEYVEPSSDEQ
ncbi:MAG: bifunctional 3,4-dihydroxy-2-butanone-4-phosphate synthase/GTP cyclohydrolase II, partial [Nitrococcus sp.]|nr:bifunctional 3,4-dihydroxy-2-butanone-4-phosphate synthase/GTP cyclohydrolase II [Nitrococcus sp.]